MSVVFVILGAVSFGLGYAVLELGDPRGGVGLFLEATVLLVAAIILDGINRAFRTDKRE